jgi:PPK2 family polyphosphate:nucleotide phosphotransferase
MGKIDAGSFRAKPGETVKLADWPTRTEPVYQSKKDYRKQLARHVKQLSKLQNLLYATNQYALLLIFQAMDAAGKDGAIKHVMSGVNPQGCQVFSFKHPSEEELDHDFLWRTTKCLPERGRIGIFNRSYYEEVLVVRVHPGILHAENIPEELLDQKGLWEKRYRSMTDLEDHLHRNGTRVLKFFLHLSKEEQRKRFLERIEKPSKNWKFSAQDLEERKYWNDYTRAYESCIAATTSKQAPWYIIPADDKPTARLLVSAAIVGALKELNMNYPESDAGRQAELQRLRVELEAQKEDA